MNYQRAILLAAGLGSRLEAAIDDRPKCLVDVLGRSLLDHQLHAFRTVGVREIVLIVGHRAELIQHATLTHDDLRFTFITNPHYAHSNTLWSLAHARHMLDAPTFIANADVLFGPALLERLLQLDALAVAAIEVKPCGEEEVKVCVDGQDGITALSKDVPQELALGEYIGVMAARAPFLDALREALSALGAEETARHAYYEVALLRAMQHHPLRAARLHGEPVIEIDFPEDLRRAREVIAPLLVTPS